MDVKEFLEQAKKIDEEISALEKAKQDALSDVIYKSPTFDEAVLMSKGNLKEEKSVAYTSYVEELDKQQTALLRAKDNIIKAISKLPKSKDRTLMTEHYINNKPMIEIAMDQNTDLSALYKRRAKAISFMEKHLKDC